MLASRTSRVLARKFSTVAAESGAFKVAAVDNGGATSSVTLLVKAGSRYESAAKPGVAHALKNFAFKSTKARSALGTVRESELYGGVLSASLSREHLALTAEFLRGDEAFFVDLLTSFITSSKFVRHEFEEYVLPVVQAESTAAANDPSVTAVDVAHSIAFRNSGLGASLFAPTHSHITQDDVKAYAQSVFTPGNIAILGSGIDKDVLAALVSKAVSSSSAAPPAAPATTASKYFGGETRVDSHSGLQTVFFGFGVTGAAAADPALAVLAAHLNPAPSIKWSTGTSPILAQLHEQHPTASVQAVYLPYSDATLVGFLVQGETAESVKEAGTRAVKALKDAAAGVKDLKTAVAKAKFSIATAVDGREGAVAVLGPKVLAKVEPSITSTLTAFGGVDAAAVTKAAASLLKAKPTFVAVGDVKALPFADELGL